MMDIIFHCFFAQEKTDLKESHHGANLAWENEKRLTTLRIRIKKSKKENILKWKSNPENYEKAALSWRRRDYDAKAWLYSIITEYKNKPCTDCGMSYPPWVMDFDHIDPKTKIAGISQLSKWRGNKEKLLEEIAKCELVCSNCHRQRTHDRKLTMVSKLASAKNSSDDSGKGKKR